MLVVNGVKDIIRRTPAIFFDWHSPEVGHAPLCDCEVCILARHPILIKVIRSNPVAGFVMEKRLSLVLAEFVHRYTRA